MVFEVRTEDFRDPFDSNDTLVRVEEEKEACDGVVCGTAVEDEQGQPVSSQPHSRHLVVSGYNPLASPRYLQV